MEVADVGERRHPRLGLPAQGGLSPGKLAPESPVSLDRDGWPVSVGISGQIGPE